LISEINDRFTSALSTDQSFTSILTEQTQILTAAEIPDLISLCSDDLPSPECLETELHCWGAKRSDAEVQ